MDSGATASLCNYKQKSFEVFVTLMLFIILNFVVLISMYFVLLETYYVLNKFHGFFFDLKFS